MKVRYLMARIGIFLFISKFHLVTFVILQRSFARDCQTTIIGTHGTVTNFSNATLVSRTYSLANPL